MFVQLGSSTRNEPIKAPSTTLSRTVSREIISSAVYKRQQRDLTSSKLNVKGPKQAEALHVAEIYNLRKQLTALPVDLKEDARINYTLTQMNNQRSLQDFQCKMLVNVEKILKNEMIQKGQDYRKYRIGGQEDGTYERFFRIEPSRFMSKPQFTTALRLVFGENMIKSAPMINKLYESFDLRRTDEMDWRSMLFLLNILMQPTLSCKEQLKLGYALYSSVGCLDPSSAEKLPLGVLKDLIATPVQLSMRPTLTSHMNEAWQHLMQYDEQVIQFSAKATEKHQKHDMTGKGLDPNEMKIPSRMFMKLLTETSMAQFFEAATPFGKRDLRPWSYHLEETFYHPTLLQRVKTLRREIRNDDMAVWFLAQQDFRRKRFVYATWIEFIRRRIKLRIVLIAAEIRATIANYHVFFSHIRKVCLEFRAALQCQRVMRGFLSRRRRHFIKRLQRKVTKMQSSTRQYLQRLSYSRQRMRLYWAAVTIQRVYRGRRARIRVSTIVQALFDQRVRQLAKDRANWMIGRMTRAMMCIKRYWNRYCRRKKMMEVMRLRDLEEEISEEMQRVQEASRVAWELYKQALSQWYEERKMHYDEEVLTELHTKEQRKLLIERRSKIANEIKLRKQLEREARLAKLEEEQIEYWLKNWDEKIIKRGEQRRQTCKNAMRLPETPEEIQIKKDITIRTKANIKNVLRRADMQKIPMEIPEAFTISEQEIIEEEVQAAMEQARKEMKEEGLRIEEEKRVKAEQQRLEELAEKQRKMKWAVVTIQTYARVYLACKRVRHKAYERYTKFFDREYHEYYYQDNVTKHCLWSKPKSLGSYDIIMEDYWIILPVRRAAKVISSPYSFMPAAPELSSETPVGIEATFETFYFYQPSSWKQTWVQPEYTVMCALCQSELAEHYAHMDYQCYCSGCMQKQVYEVWTQGEYGYHMRDIRFQSFNGGRIDASYMDMSDILVQDYYTYIMKIDPSLQMSAEEEEEENRRSHIMRRRKRLSQELHYCLQCKEQIATMFCADCPKHRCIFCGKCDVHLHRKGKKKLHKRQRLFLEQARAAATAAHAAQEEAEQTTSFPKLGQLGSMMSSVFKNVGMLGKTNDDEEDDSDSVGSSVKSVTGPLDRQGSSVRLPPILPASASWRSDVSRESSQKSIRIDGNESSSASSDSVATKERKAKELAKKKKEEKKRKLEKKKPRAGGDEGTVSRAEDASKDELPTKKIKKKNKNKTQAQNSAESDFYTTDTDTPTVASDTTATSQRKKDGKKKRSKSPEKIQSTSKSMGELETKRPFTASDTSPIRKPKSAEKKKKRNAASPSKGKSETASPDRVTLPSITVGRSQTAPSATTLSDPMFSASVQSPPETPSINKKTKKQKKKQSARSDVENNTYDGGDESSVFTKNSEQRLEDDQTLSSGPAKKRKAKVARAMSTSKESVSSNVVDDSLPNDNSITKKSKKTKKGKKKKASEQDNAGIDTDVSQLTADDGDDHRNGMQSDASQFMDSEDHLESMTRHISTMNDRSEFGHPRTEAKVYTVDDSIAVEVKKKKKKKETNEGQGNAESTDGEGKRKKKKKKEINEGQGNAESTDEEGKRKKKKKKEINEGQGNTESTDEEGKRKKKKKKVISGVLAGLEDARGMESVLETDARSSATGLDSTASKLKKKKKKKPKSATSDDSDAFSTLKKIKKKKELGQTDDKSTSGGEFSEMKKKKKRKKEKDDGQKSGEEGTQYTTDTDASTIGKKKEKIVKSKKKESTASGVDSDSSPDQRAKKKKSGKKKKKRAETTTSMLIAALDNVGI